MVQLLRCKAPHEHPPYPHLAYKLLFCAIAAFDHTLWRALNRIPIAALLRHRSIWPHCLACAPLNRIPTSCSFAPWQHLTTLSGVRGLWTVPSAMKSPLQQHPASKPTKYYSERHCQTKRPNAWGLSTILSVRRSRFWVVTWWSHASYHRTISIPIS